MNDGWLSLFGCVVILSLSMLLAAGFVLVWYAFIVVKIEHTSMEPTLKPGERVLVLRLWPDRWLRKGQVVIIVPLMHNQPGPRLNRTVKPGFRPFIKRIVGVQGDTITATVADLEQIRQHHEAYIYEGGGQRTWHIPPQHIFVVGDNHPIGDDSLTWGPIPAWNVLGIALIKLPFGTLGARTRSPARYLAPREEPIQGEY
jgi:signal peptidase I